ncbi:MAG: WD40/YVTN/BNR-like repeat-containing protein [Rhizomicrobium sp.]
MASSWRVRLFASASAAAVLVVSGSGIGAQTAVPQVNPALYQALHWRDIGPYRGGRSLAVTGIPGDPYTFYMGAVAGGVWKTTDAGGTWTPLSDKAPFWSVGAIAVAPSNRNIIYVGTGEAAPRGDITYGDGVYKSADGGRTWMHVGLADSRQIGALIVDPANPDIVLVAALGHAFGANAERGIYRTTDGGKTWTRVLGKDNKTGGIDVTFDPHNAKIVYASLWQALRQPWNFSSGGPGSGLYRSTDGGVTWAQLTGNGLPGGILGRIDVSVSGADSNRIYAMIEAKDGGLFRSDDHGAHWRRVNDDGRLRQRAWYFSKIYADPKHADTVYALNTGLFRSTDGGKTFKLLPARHGDHHGLWIDPTDPDRLINASDGGASVSVDGGKTWSTELNQPTAQFYHVAVDNDFPYHVYGAQQDNSSIAIASSDDEGAITGKDWYDVGGGEAGFVVPDPRDSNIVYSDSENLIVRWNKKTDQARVISVWPIDASGHAAADLQHRFNWTSPLMLSPHNPDTIYVGMERVYRSTDDGNSWTAISPDLTRNDKSKQGPSGGPITKDITSVEYYDTVFSIAESPLKKGLLWVGSDDGLIHTTSDDGAHWADVTPRDMPQWSTISMIEPSHFDAETAYVAVDRHKLDDINPYVFKTADGGKTWTRLDRTLPAGAFVHAVREDPQRRGLLYAGTETGVFVSFDDGVHWQSLQLDLPHSPVHDLVVKGDDLVIATHGRSFWILDDVTPLRQIGPDTARSNVVLYKPENAVRLYYPDSVDRRPPVGENPPAGAVIDYYFEAKPAGEITIDILDAQGRRARHLSSKAPKTAGQPPEWPDELHPSNTLPARAGMNRFVWNLRYDDPTEIPGAFYAGEPPRGPIAMPGRYTVKLTVGGKSQSVPLVLMLDPRDHGSAPGLAQKFTLSMRVYHDQDTLHRAVNGIRAAKAELAALHLKGGVNAGLAGQADALARQASGIEGQLMQVNIKGSEANLNFPGMLNEQIYSFAGLLEDADTAPNVPEQQTYAGLHAKLGAELAAWTKLKQTKVDPFLAGLKKTRGK